MGNAIAAQCCSESTKESQTPVIVPTVAAIEVPNKAGDASTKNVAMQVPERATDADTNDVTKQEVMSAWEAKHVKNNSEFTIHMKRHDSSELWGWQMKKMKQTRQLFITKTGGRLLEEWEVANPTKIVNTGDEIIKVNGKSEVSEIVEALKTALEVEVVLRRPKGMNCVELCQKAVEESGACFAIFWGFDEAQGVLRAVAHWNPPDRVAAIREKTGSGELYTTESYKVQMQPGDGFIGKAYKDKEARFFPDVAELDVEGYKRKSLAARFGIHSMALKPLADGIMEIGSTRKWEACHWIHTVTADDCERAATEAGASFAIYWCFDVEKGVLRPMAHWNPPDRIAEVMAKTGRHELYTTESYKFEMTPGTGFVGKVFRDQGPMDFPDVSILPQREYQRKSLAARFGIKSVALKAFETGVMEVGCSKQWQTCDWAYTIGVDDCRWAAKEAGACFAIYWGFDKALGALKPVTHWNPPERSVAVFAATGKHELYTTESYKVQMKPGDGFIGKAYKDKEAMFFPDVKVLPVTEYKRKDLAARFGIQSMAIKPMGDGVIEIGTTGKWDACEWVNVVQPKDCERAAKEAGACFAIYWGFDEGRGLLRAMAHWNPPERIAEVIAKTGTDELYTTESYRFTFKPGKGFAGKAYQNSETMFFPDVKQLALEDYKRKSLAERFGLSSVAFKPFVNGIMEVGFTTKLEYCAWTNRVTIEDCEKVCLEAGACFCIYWCFDETRGVLKPTCHWNPPDRVAVVRAVTGKSELYTTESYKSEMKPGMGLIGNAYKYKDSKFIPDVSELSPSEFNRKELANRFGIRSIALKPYGNGVYEVGSTIPWVKCDWVHKMSVDCCRQACKDMNASFAIFWGFDAAKGVLRAACHWNPPERVAEVKAKTGCNDLYTIESSTIEFKPGEGCIGKVYTDKRPVFYHDVSNIKGNEFKRKSLAAKYNIVSVYMCYFANGVLEVGSTQKLDPGELF